MDNQSAQKSVADAAHNNWVDRFAPIPIRPYLRLARWDRPIGFWLLFWPAAYALSMAMMAKTFKHFPFSWLNFALTLALLLIGAIAMRGAGCTLNDIVDRDIDAKVARTQNRPIPAGDISVGQAFLFLALQCLVGLLVLIQFNSFTQILALSSLGLVAIYPFMKRITYWPQLFLGLCFGWGALVGWSIVFGTLHLPAVLLYLGTVAWIIGYDTIYALQDTKDDALIGVKSTALLFGKNVRPVVALFYAMTIVLWGWAGLRAGGGLVFLLGLTVCAGALAAQIVLLHARHGARALVLFKSNHLVGALLFLVFGIEFWF